MQQASGSVLGVRGVGTYGRNTPDMPLSIIPCPSQRPTVRLVKGTAQVVTFPQELWAFLSRRADTGRCALHTQTANLKDLKCAQGRVCGCVYVCMSVLAIICVSMWMYVQVHRWGNGMLCLCTRTRVCTNSLHRCVSCECAVYVFVCTRACVYELGECRFLPWWDSKHPPQQPKPAFPTVVWGLGTGGGEGDLSSTLKVSLSPSLPFSS